jgi:hypothetical protein
MNYSENEKKLENVKESIRKLHSDILIKKSFLYSYDFVNDRPINEKGIKRRLHEDVCKAFQNEL